MESKEVYGIIRNAINNLPVDKARIMKDVLAIVEEWDHPSFLTSVLAGELAEAKIKAHALNKELYAYKDILKNDSRGVKAVTVKFEKYKELHEREQKQLGKEIDHLGVIIKERNGTINDLKLRIQELQDEERSI